jgi:hypothetical protein
VHFKERIPTEKEIIVKISLLGGKILIRMKILNPIQNQTRHLTLLVAVLAIAALFLLASSLNNLEIGPGERLILPTQQEVVPEIYGRHHWDGAVFFRILIFLALTLFLVSLVVVIRSAENRKRAIKLIVQNMLMLAGFVLMIALLSNIYNPEVEDEDTTPAGTFFLIPPPTTTDEQEPAKPVEYSPPPQPSGLIFIITLLLILAAGASAYWFWRLKHPQKQQLHKIARKALDDLAMSGSRDWQDIVIRCYADMSSTVSQRMELQRNKSMTPAEFSSRLEKAGLPSKPVHNLTHLFEKARYGSQQSSTGDVQEAMACLSAILQAVERRA